MSENGGVEVSGDNADVTVEAPAEPAEGDTNITVEGDGK